MVNLSIQFFYGMTISLWGRYMVTIHPLHLRGHRDVGYNIARQKIATSIPL